MEYNTARTNLIIPEYGRHIQKMVDHCMSIEDEKERNEFAQIIIEVMGELNPHLRDIPDFQHKLWDQLFIMSKFKLDVKSPYPIPTQEEVYSKPNKVAYPKDEYKYKYYGKNIRRMIKVALEWEGDKQEGLVMVIANHMKKCYLIWNKDTVDDKTIFNHLYELSDSKIDLRNTEETLLSPDRLQVNTVNTSRKNTNNKQKNQNNRNNNFKQKK
ncbi:DUF4290 domain-containing protein [Moheibacter stercoris]|uniref:DUF4290 domain-containing protein n=1 Tax=Moheibacter stercoris TaxID=1628251 RepID=A0ABV2LSM4_9FLAO